MSDDLKQVSGREWFKYIYNGSDIGGPKKEFIPVRILRLTGIFFERRNTMTNFSSNQAKPGEWLPCLAILLVGLLVSSLVGLLSG